MSPLQSKHLPYQIHSYPRVTVFTLEEAKGHGLRVMTRVGGKGAVAKIYGMPRHPPTPHPPAEPCEVSGSKPGGLLQAQGGADLGGLIVKPSSYSLLCWGLRGLGLGRVLPLQLH